MRLESQNRAITLEGGGDVIGRGNREKEIEKKLHFLYEEAKGGTGFGARY